MNKDEKTPNEKPITSLSAEEQERFREFLDNKEKEEAEKRKYEKRVLDLTLFIIIVGGVVFPLIKSLLFLYR